MRNGVTATLRGVIAAVLWLAFSCAALADEALIEDPKEIYAQSQDIFSSQWSREFQVLLSGLIVLFVGILITCIAVLVNRRLSRLVAARTAELQHEVEDKVRALGAHVESEDRFRALIEQASDGIFIADPDWRLMDVNNQG